MKYHVKKSLSPNWDILIVCLLLLWYGHPLTSLIPILLGVPSLSFNFGLKVLFLLLCFVPIYKNRRYFGSRII
jgi:hypothetical protein